MKKENDILEMLSRREEEFHLPLRTDGWEKLETELTPPPVIRRVFYRWLAVAAVILLCLSVSIPLFFQKETSVKVPSEKMVLAPVAKPEEIKQVVSIVEEIAVEVDSLKPKTAIFTALSFPEIEVPDSGGVVLYESVVPERPVLADQSDQTKQAVRRNKDAGPLPDEHGKMPKDWNNQVKVWKKQYVPKWSFGILAGSNGVSTGQGGVEGIEQYESNPGPNPPNPGPDPDDPDDGNRPESIMTRASASGGSNSGGSSTQYRFYRHRMPVTASLSVRYELLPHLALESGLSYTYLSSEIVYRDKSRVGSQSLHYLGIPLKLNWTFYDQKNFSFYLSGGAMLEYCLSARKTIGSDSEMLNVYPWQASFHAGVGAQLELVKPVSLFVEPGVGYYFETLNYRRRYLDIETIRTVHPLTFNLQVGIRLTY